jgi:hypothetical protein
MPLPSSFPSLIEHVRDETCVFVDVMLDFSPAKIARIEKLWAPVRRQLPAHVEHLYWSWNRKKDDFTYRLIAVMCEGRCEGLLAANRTLRRSRTQQCDILYVAYVESAPWNHPHFPGGAEFRGVGTNLMMGAILVSQQLQAAGAIGLHSLNSSRAAYLHWGMTNFGRDPQCEDLTYFEFSSEHAIEFLAKRTG